MIKCIASIFTFLFIASTVSAQCWSNGAISDDELAHLVQSTFPAGTIQATGENIQAIAFAVAKAESSGNPSACGDCGTENCKDDVNPSTSSIGLWQINLHWHPEYDRVSLFDSTENARAALKISKNGQDWTPWSTYKNDMYKNYLEEAALALGLGSSSQEGVSQTRPSIREQMDAAREAMNRARYNEQQDDLASTEVMSIGFPVALTLYVHEGDINGPTISGVLVTGQDGAGNSFEEFTDSNGYVTITGISGTWSFSASAEGYETNSWSQSITETDTKDAFLKEVQSSTNSVVGKWAFHFKMENFESSTEKLWHDPDSPDEWDTIIEFYQDGTFLDSPLSEYSVATTGEWNQNENAISLYGTGNSKNPEGDYSEEFSDSLNGLIEGNVISGTGICVSHGKFCETQYETYCENLVTFDTSTTYSWTASRV